MVTAGMLPRAAVREVEARLCAAGCPDADFDAAELFRLAVGGDARLADAPLGAEQAERLGSPDGPPRGPGAFAIPLRQLALPRL